MGYQKVNIVLRYAILYATINLSGFHPKARFVTRKYMAKFFIINADLVHGETTHWLLPLFCNQSVLFNAISTFSYFLRYAYWLNNMRVCLHFIAYTIFLRMAGAISQFLYICARFWGVLCSISFFWRLRLHKPRFPLSAKSSRNHQHALSHRQHQG